MFKNIIKNHMTSSTSHGADCHTQLKCDIFQPKAHQVRTEAIVNRLHRLARVVELKQTMVVVHFKGGACGERRGRKSLFSPALYVRKTS